jgi:hypothetical protein
MGVNVDYNPNGAQDPSGLVKSLAVNKRLNFIE